MYSSKYKKIREKNHIKKLLIKKKELEKEEKKAKTRPT
jgi:hypothetical protein